MTEPSSLGWDVMTTVGRIAYALENNRRDRLNKIKGKTLTEYELGALVDDVIACIDYVPNPKRTQVSTKSIAELAQLGKEIGSQGFDIPEYYKRAPASTANEVQVAVDNTLVARGGRYGKFNGVAQITQALKAEMRATPNWDSLSFDKKEALEMIAQKIARILNGDPNYHDSWHDIAGYAELVASALQGVQK